MKKTSKLFGAVALSAALALGTAAPAFAADNLTTKTDDTTKVSTNDTPTNVANGGAATSYINIQTTIDQLNVTLPLHMTVVASVDGNLTTPSANAYKIKNTSSIPVKVSNIKATVNDSKWNLVNTSNLKGTDAPTDTTKIGNINLTAKVTYNGSDGNAATDSVALSECTGNDGKNTDWAITGVSTTTPNPALAVDWTGSQVSKLRGVYSGTDSVSLDAFTVQYTIAKATDFTGSSHVES